MLVVLVLLGVDASLGDWCGFENLRTLEVKNSLIYVSIIKTPLQGNWICLVVVSGGSSTHASSQF